ncbi:CocE/NonD family hydrolase [bacterium]|nr:CocE/NonD family hydrolase [bacterium]
MRYRYIWILLVILFSTGQLSAQLPYVETAVTMRDGKEIATDIYHNGGIAAKPVILVQTPYNKRLYRVSLNLPKTVFPLDTSAYHYVFADWRGFYGSKDAAAGTYDRGLDGYDLVEWIAAQPWCNGKVGTYGGSALGMIQFQTASHHPPHLVCAMPMIIDYRTDYNDYYYGGVLRREHVESLSGLGFVTVGIITSQPVENAVWDIIREQNDYPDEIAVPLLMVSGWYDHYPTDVLRAFHDLRERSDVNVRSQHKLIMGPWLHSTVDHENQGEMTYPESANVAKEAALQFFAYHLLGAKNGWPLQPVLRYYQMGDNTWQTADSWPDVASAEQSWYLHDDGSLTPAAPAASEQSRTFSYDPRDPSPSHGGARFNPFDNTVDPGPIDIRTLVEQRDDVLLYTSAELTQAVRVQGGMQVDLHVQSDRTDTDFSVRLCDVQPDGRSIILTDGIIRARFREGTDKEILLTPGETVGVTITLQEMAHTFLPGHRIRLIIGSADYPRFDINLNDGGELYTDGDTLVATNSIMHALSTPSRLLLETASPVSSASGIAQPTELRIKAIAPQPWTGNSPLTIVCSGRELLSGGEVRIYDLLGRVRQRIAVPPSNGNVTLQWNGLNADGTPASAGIYLLQLHTRSSSRSRQILRLSAH